MKTRNEENLEQASTTLGEPDTDALVSQATGRPLTKRGQATRAHLLEAAEAVFAKLGYHDASVVKITERAGIGLGTFYLYFDSKKSIFEALVLDLNRRVRQSMSEAMEGAADRIEAERMGFEGFFRFTAQHPALYRVVREAEFVSPDVLHAHYERILRGYRAGLQAAQVNGDINPILDPEITAWALMGMGELIGMRFILWKRDADGNPPQQIDQRVIDGIASLLANALANPSSHPITSTNQATVNPSSSTKDHHGTAT